MKLTGKLILALALTLLGVLTVTAGFRLRRDIDRFEAQRRTANHLLGRTVAGAASRIWSTVGQDQAFDLVADANERESDVTIRWVWVDAPAGDPRAPELDLPAVRDLRPGTTIDLRAAIAEGDATYTYVPIAGPRPAAVELKQSLAVERQYVRDTVLQTVALTLLPGVASALPMAALGYALIGKPMRLLVDKARRVGRGDLSGDLHLPQHDEISELAEEMNAMCARLSTAQERAAAEAEARVRALEQLRHADRLMTVGKLAAGLAHELGTPLNVITGRSQIICDARPGDGEIISSSARVIADQAARMADILRQLLDFARRRPAQKAPMQLRGVVQQSVELLQAMARKRGVSLELSGAAGPTVAVDPAQLQQAIANLIVNAVDAMPQGGIVTVSIMQEIARAPADAGGAEMECARIDVVDAGAGIRPEALPHIFEPFFTTKEVGEGTGLGLSVTYGIVKEHRGWIEVRSEPGRGSRFSIFLPLERG
jgi:two-component system, NtrC family, sensor kinase